MRVWPGVDLDSLTLWQHLIDGGEVSLQKQGQLNVRWPHIGAPSNKIGEDEGEYSVKLRKQGTWMSMFVNRITKGKQTSDWQGENEKSRYIRCEQDTTMVQFLVWRMQIFTPYIRHAIIFNTGCHVIQEHSNSSLSITLEMENIVHSTILNDFEPQ